jgi:hypothetical protein
VDCQQCFYGGLKFFYRETKNFHFGSEIFSRWGWKFFTLILEFSAWDSNFSTFLVVAIALKEDKNG